VLSISPRHWKGLSVVFCLKCSRSSAPWAKAFCVAIVHQPLGISPSLSTAQAHSLVQALDGWGKITVVWGQHQEHRWSQHGMSLRWSTYSRGFMILLQLIDCFVWMLACRVCSGFATATSSTFLNFFNLMQLHFLNLNYEACNSSSNCIILTPCTNQFMYFHHIPF
jgi:hypothetical protein